MVSILRRSRKVLRRLYLRSREGFFLRRVKRYLAPAHVAIIMDGNGRWADERGLPRLAGHRAGAKAIRQVIETAPELGIKYLTLYAFSVENWRRPQEEVMGLMKLFEEMIGREIDDLHRNGVKLNFIGQLEELPESTRKAFKKATELTESNDKLNLSVAINYGGRTEIIDAVRKIVKAAEKDGRVLDELNPDSFGKYLYTANVPEPELLIRTSGELRISNFLLWQIAYSELWVTPTFWPDFTRGEFIRAIYDFQQRKRRFGGLDTEG